MCCICYALRNNKASTLIDLLYRIEIYTKVDFTSSESHS